MDTDSSFVVAEVVPALSVPCGPVQEWAPETLCMGWGVTHLCPMEPGPLAHERHLPPEVSPHHPDGALVEEASADRPCFGDRTPAPTTCQTL